MAFNNASSFVVTLLAMCLVMSAHNAPIATARNLIEHPTKPPGYNMAARIKAGGEGGEGGLAECWNALVELKSCSNEIVLFFINGQADIGPDCCKGIAVITRHCWPAMLTSLGFTAEEGNILRGYCDATSAAANNTSSAPASPPLAAAAAAAKPGVHPAN